MKSLKQSLSLFFLCSSSLMLSSCKTVVLEKIPVGGSLPYQHVVYVNNDGRCQHDQVIKVTGGNNSKNIPRKYECIDKP